MKRSWIILVIVFGILAGGYFTYQWYLTTPYYSLIQIKSSLKKHDWDTFSTFVDVDRVSRGVSGDINDIIKETIQDKVSPTIRHGLGFLVSMKIRSSLKKDLKAWVEGEPAPKGGMLGSFIQQGEDASPPKIKDISWEDDKGTATLGFKNGNSLDLAMEKKGITWQVVRILNIRDIYEESKKKQQGS